MRNPATAGEYKNRFINCAIGEERVGLMVQPALYHTRNILMVILFGLPHGVRYFRTIYFRTERG